MWLLRDQGDTGGKRMKPRCSSCISFEDRKKKPIAYRNQGFYKVIFEMKILIFDGHCRLAQTGCWGRRPFFLCLRNKTFICEKWKWRGKKS